MSRTKLRSRDVALLERLSYSPLEIGDIPKDSAIKLIELGLVRQVLGCCELTHAGQLMIHRQHFLRASGRRVARVTKHNPLFLQETRFFSPSGAKRFADFLKMRALRKAERAAEAQGTGREGPLERAARFGSETVGRIRSVFQASPDLDGGMNSKLNHEPR